MSCGLGVTLATDQNAWENEEVGAFCFREVEGMYARLSFNLVLFSSATSRLQFSTNTKEIINI